MIYNNIYSPPITHPSGFDQQTKKCNELEYLRQSASKAIQNFYRSTKEKSINSNKMTVEVFSINEENSYK